MRNKIIDYSFIKAIFNTQGKHPDGRVGKDAFKFIKKEVEERLKRYEIKIIEEPMWFDILEQYEDNNGELNFHILIKFNSIKKINFQSLFILYNVKNSSISLLDEYYNMY